jgi:hypothetical protein
MFETPEERVKFLKAGIDGKTIEKLYILDNNFKIVRFPMLFENDEIDIESNGLTYETDETHITKQNSFLDFPHLVERFSMIEIPQFVQGFQLFRTIPINLLGG